MVNLSGGVVTVTEGRGVVVARVMSGSFMTSLEMAGVSLSLMKADQETLRLFGKPVQTSTSMLTLFFLKEYFDT